MTGTSSMSHIALQRHATEALGPTTTRLPHETRASSLSRARASPRTNSAKEATAI